ncbi:hypothetical protein JW758_04160 [Candidatus Peregrinibacteria bacterium]|nr:hypothetical protein [Candidatus Peregrinibacteria bacterium]
MRTPDKFRSKAKTSENVTAESLIKSITNADINSPMQQAYLMLQELTERKQADPDGFRAATQTLGISRSITEVIETVSKNGIAKYLLASIKSPDDIIVVMERIEGLLKAIYKPLCDKLDGIEAEADSEGDVEKMRTNLILNGINMDGHDEGEVRNIYRLYELAEEGKKLLSLLSGILNESEDLKPEFTGEVTTREQVIQRVIALSEEFGKAKKFAFKAAGDMQNVRKELEGTIAKVDELIRQKEELEASHKLEMATATETIRDGIAEIAELSRKVDELEAQAEKSGKNEPDDGKTVQNGESKVIAKVTKLQEEVAQKDAKIADQKAQIEELTTQIEDLQSQLEGLRTQLEEKEKPKKDKEQTQINGHSHDIAAIDKLQTQIEALKDQITAAAEARENLEAGHLNELKLLRDRTIKEKDDMANQIATLETELKELRKLKSNVETERTSFSGAPMGWENEKVALERKIEQLESTKAEQKKLAVENMDRVRELELQNATQSKTIDELLAQLRGSGASQAPSAPQKKKGFFASLLDGNEYE